MTNAFFRLDNQTAVVTGACGKLGPVWAEALLDAGARVAALELAGAPASAAYNAVADRAGDRMRRFDCDVTDRASIQQATDALAAAGGAIDPREQRGRRSASGFWW